MANTNLNVRILNKYDTYENWSNSTLILGAGEIAIASIPSGDATGLTPPAIGVKVGDGTKTFSQLAWIQATSGDVYSWAKAATKPTYDASEITGLEEFVQDISDIDTNTQYKFTLAEDYKIKIQKKDLGDADFSDYETVDLTSAFNGKADKVTGATAGNFASLDSNGNLTDSGKNAADFATADHDHDSDYADKTATETHIADTDAHIQSGERASWSTAATTAAANAAAIQLLNKTDGTVGSVKKTVDDAIEALDLANTYAAKDHNHDDAYDAKGSAKAVSDYVGTFTAVGDETTVVGYINAKIGAIPEQTDYAVTVTESTPTGYAKAYTFTQCGSEITTINIPKDMVVESGTVETKTEAGEWGDSGTYLHLVLANATDDDIYINVGDLIEYVTGATATDGIITTSVNASHVLTATINDGTVTLAKLDAETQTKINKAHEHTNKAILDGITAEKVSAWDAAQANVLENVAGVTGSITDKTFTVTGVSTDLLTQGTNAIVFNCGNSAT